MDQLFIVFFAGVLVGSAITFLLMRHRARTRPQPPSTPEVITPAAVDEPLANTTVEDLKVLDLDAQRMAAAARIRDQRAASRAQREAQHIAAEAEALREAQRAEAQAEAQREAQRIAAEAEALREAQRAEAQAEAQREAQRIAAEAEALREAQRAEAQAEAQRESLRIAAAEEAQRIAAEMALQRSATKPIKTPEETIVMIVDDSKVGRVKTNRFLLNNQFKAQMAEDGRDAVQKIAAHMPDIVITDVEMPEMDGFELTQEIRRNPATAHLPVIIISGNNDGYAERAHEVGADLILGKPYSEADMVEHLHRFMRNGR